jgi:hypothetical protein
VCIRCGAFVCERCARLRPLPWCRACEDRLGVTRFPLRRDEWSSGRLWALAMRALREHWTTLALAAGLWALLGDGLAVAGGLAAAGASELLQVGLGILGPLVHVAVWLGFQRMTLAALFGARVDVGELQAHPLERARTALGLLLAAALVLLPAALLVLFAYGFVAELAPPWAAAAATGAAALPVLGVLVGFALAPMELAHDPRAGIFTALGRSWRLMHGQRLRTAAVFVLSSALAASGVLLFGFGQFVTFGLGQLLVSAWYLTLRNGSGLAEVGWPASPPPRWVRRAARA